MHKFTSNSPRRAAALLISAGALAFGLWAGCGSSSSDSVDASPQNIHDAAPIADADVGDDADTDHDAGQPSQSKRAIWFGDLTTDGVDELRLYDGAAGIAAFTVAGVTVIDEIQAVAVSPDGTQLSIALAHDGGTPSLYVANTDGTGTPILILDAGSADVEFSAIAWSPDGTALAYISDSLLNGQKLVFAAPADGSAIPTLVSQNTGDAGQDAQTVSWTDNSHVVYRGDFATEGVENFYISNIAASPISPAPLVSDNLLASNAAVRNRAAFAGGKVYFKSNHEGSFKIYRVDPDGGNLEVVPALAALTNGSGSAEGGTFAISPAGTSIAFSADSPTAFLYQVYVAPLDGAATLQSNAAVSNPTPSSIRGPVGPKAIRWSADGSMLGVAADWPVGAGDLDNDTAGFIVPATGAAGGLRVWNVGAASSGQDLSELAFTSDSSTVLALGDIRTNNEVEVYLTTDLATADQDSTTTLAQGVPSGGDVSGLAIVP